MSIQKALILTIQESRIVETFRKWGIWAEKSSWRAGYRAI